jgi:uncharacterized spore protein YtfJ
MFDREKEGQEVREGKTLLERFARTIGSSASARTVFADPVVRGGTTVIPVATVRYGFGAGSGTNEKQERGGGGGGGVKASPVGYIEIRDDETSFRPIVTNTTRVGVIVAVGLTGMLMLFGLGRVMGRMKEEEPA